MYTEERMRAAVETLMREIDAPPVRLAEIKLEIARSQPNVRQNSRFLRLAVATACVVAGILVVWSSYSLGFVQAIKDDINRVHLRAMGGWAPPPMPDSLRQAVLKQSWSSPNRTLTTAQALVPFTIVPPAGLPRDVVSAKIRAAPTWVYSVESRSWAIGPKIVWFIYHRTRGRSFELLADQFDPKAGPSSKYIVEVQDPGPNGRPVYIKHRHFEWRDGDQVMSAVDGSGISVSEIEAIRSAMHGVALPESWPWAPEPGTAQKAYPAPEPVAQ